MPRDRSCIESMLSLLSYDCSLIQQRSIPERPNNWFGYRSDPSCFDNRSYSLSKLCLVPCESESPQHTGSWAAHGGNHLATVRSLLCTNLCICLISQANSQLGQGILLALYSTIYLLAFDCNQSTHPRSLFLEVLRGLRNSKPQRQRCSNQNCGCPKSRPILRSSCLSDQMASGSE